MNELSIESFTNGAGPYFKRRTVHPYERMFTVAELCAGLGDCGLKALYVQTRNPLRLLPYLIIVAQKS
jgi:hypothetical protein